MRMISLGVKIFTLGRSSYSGRSMSSASVSADMLYIIRASKKDQDLDLGEWKMKVESMTEALTKKLLEVSFRPAGM